MCMCNVSVSLRRTNKVYLRTSSQAFAVFTKISHSALSIFFIKKGNNSLNNNNYKIVRLGTFPFPFQDYLHLVIVYRFICYEK